MKILHIVPSYKPAYIYGGPIESVSRLCEGLAAQGHQVDVLTTTANGEKELDVPVGEAVMVDGVRVIYFNRITKDPTHISPALWKYLMRHAAAYDMIHIQSWWNILVVGAACICHWKKAKVVIAPRGMLSRYIFESGNTKMKKLIHYTVGKRALRKSWFHATADAEYMECQGIIKDWKGFTQPNILSLPALQIEKKENKVFTLIFMSRLHPKKGIEILFHALSKINFPVRLNIAGSGEEEYVASLKNLAAELNIAEKITWLGWMGREEKFKALMEADLFTLVSLNENFANIVVESLHMGTPVLLSADVGLSHFVKEQDMGWVSSLEVDDVVAQLETAWQDEPKRARIAEQGRKVIEAHFSAATLIGNYVEEYQKIIDTN